MPNTNITGMRLVQDGQKSQVLNLSNARRKTYAQLENMTTDQKKGVIICEDYPGGGAAEAEDIAYDNTTSQMTAMNVQDAIDELNTNLTVLLTGTITAGNTSLTISNAKITTSSIIDIYFEDKVLAPTNVTVTTGQIVIEIDAQDSNVNVGVRVL